MTKQDLIHQIFRKKTFLCVGLDTDIQKVPKHLMDFPDPVFEFNRQIIDATKDYCVAYKPNIAFYEAAGRKGWESLERTLDYIPQDCFTIADAKRGDIGNTSGLYARAFFDKEASGLSFDSVTVAPYMGRDSVQPFLEYTDKWVILLALTSNVGSHDFQYTDLKEGEKLFEKVLRTSQTWGTDENMMYVVGATQAQFLRQIREIIPHHFLLIPGVGAQGGSLKDVAKCGLTSEGGLLVNSSRAIIYASNDETFAERAHEQAALVQKEMASYL